MSGTVDINDRLVAAAIKAEGASEIMRRVANDPAGASIPTESGPLPSIAEWFVQLGGEIGLLPGRVTDLENFDVQMQGAFEGLSLNMGSVAAGVSGIGFPDLADPASVVQSPSTANRANPSISDPALANTAAQLHRVYNTGAGALSAQSASTLGTFAVTRKYSVVAGQTYTMSMHGAQLGFNLYFTASPFIGFYNADGTFHSQITSGFVRGTGDRSIVFTVPAGASKVAFTLRNATEFSNSLPMSESELQICINNLMLNEGGTALTFSPYTDGTYSPTAALFNPLKSGSVTVVLQGEYVYVRAACQLSDTKDVVWRVRFRHGVNYFRVDSKTGVVDFYGIRFIDKAVAQASTIAAFNQSTDLHSAGMDESTPEKLNGMYLGGGHGVTSYAVTMAAHGKAAVDVGSIWSDGTSNWVLTYIESTSRLVFVRRYTGTATKWSISSAAPASATFVHVSGATNTANVTFTAPTLSQFVPILRQHVYRLQVDGEDLVTDGVYMGSTVILSEIYSLLNPAAQQDYLIAHVGAATPDYVNLGIAEQIRAFNEFTWNAWGALCVRTGRGIKQEYGRAAGAMGDYWGAIQLQRLTLAGDSTPGPNTSIHLYVPNVQPIAGYDFQAIADITANNSLVMINKSDCTDPANPASHFCQFGKDAVGIMRSGHLYGFNRAEGLGVPSARSAACNTLMLFSSAEKQYPVVIDSAAGDAAANDVLVATAFRAPFLPTDADLTIPGVVVTMGGNYYCYITAHKTLAQKVVNLPEKLNGLAVTVVKSDPNVVVHSNYVAGGAVSISVTGSYGDVVLLIG